MIIIQIGGARAVLTEFDEYTNLERPAGRPKFPEKRMAGMSALRDKANIYCPAYSPDFIGLSRAFAARADGVADKQALWARRNRP
jgi:hypothetical protein